MALPSLATVSDLQVRDSTVADNALSQAMLAVASASIRNAAGSPVAETTSTVALAAWGDQFLQLPGQPVTAVASVTVDGTTVSATEYKLLSGRLWRRYGWGHESEPSEVVVTLTHGLPEVPADLVDLTCNLALAGKAAAESGDTFDPRAFMERIDDYMVQYRQGEEAVASVMDLPAGSRRMLAARFGGGADVIEYR